MILYDTNVLGTKGPRKLSVLVPLPRLDGTASDARPGLSERVKQGDFTGLISCQNKAPRWNESLGAYCLNFNGRVTLPSVKNFQLAESEDAERIAMQFGRVSDSHFTLDYSYRALQYRCRRHHAWF